MAAALALAAAPEGFTVGDLATRVRAMAGLAECDYTVRQAAYDLRKLRAKELVTKNGRSRRYTVPADAARTMTALLVLREHVLGPIMAGCRVPMRGRRPNTWTAVDQHYEAIRRDMIALFRRDRPYPGSACRGIDNILSIIGAKRLDPVWSRLVSFGRNESTDRGLDGDRRSRKDHRYGPGAVAHPLLRLFHRPGNGTRRHRAETISCPSQPPWAWGELRIA